MAPFGAVFTVVLFTDGTEVVGLSQTGNDKSNIARYGRELCGTIATGEIFNCGGGLSLISFQCTSLACPFAIFSRISSSSCADAAGTKAETWGPRSMAVCIFSTVHAHPVLTGHPLFA